MISVTFLSCVWTDQLVLDRLQIDLTILRPFLIGSLLFGEILLH